MTTQTIPLGSVYSQAFDGHTLSNEIVPSSTRSPKAYDFSRDALTQTGVQHEFDIDDYVEQQDQATRDAIATEGTWVADTFYPGVRTLATLRLKAGLSQRQFAELCGVAQPHVSRYESGLHEPGVFLAQKMAAVLGVSLDEIAAALHQASANVNK